jgi:hypothetical protein
MKHINTLCGQNVEFLLLGVMVHVVGDTYSNCCALKVENLNADVLFMFYFSESSLCTRF